MIRSVVVYVLRLKNVLGRMEVVIYTQGNVAVQNRTEQKDAVLFDGTVKVVVHYE